MRKQSLEHSVKGVAPGLVSAVAGAETDYSAEEAAPKPSRAESGSNLAARAAHALHIGEHKTNDETEKKTKSEKKITRAQVKWNLLLCF
jgi:hypothetical protein